MTRVQSLAIFHEHYPPACFCEEMVPSCVSFWPSTYAIITLKFATQCISIELMHNVCGEYFVNCNLSTEVVLATKDAVDEADGGAQEVAGGVEREGSCEGVGLDEANQGKRGYAQ